MTQLFKTQTQETLTEPAAIKAFLNRNGIIFEQWETPAQLTPTASPEEILAAYSDRVNPYMAAHGYQTADVVNIHPGIDNYPAIRAKFLAEHTHPEDEVRFFVEGEGLFWFNLDHEPVFNLRCCAGDLISVPQGTKHWFDAGEIPNVKAIRIFSTTEGWTPLYTGSGINEQYANLATVHH
ncbi:MAG: cupin domain-containing protein [Spirulina sp. DLM2.Bin59]|nr:MAG: cupin domain-containing protein [Spirulina sp. DLM2.Bin59]